MAAAMGYPEVPRHALFFSQRRGDNIKTHTHSSTFTFQTFLKVMQSATPTVEAEMKTCAEHITNMTLQK